MDLILRPYIGALSAIGATPNANGGTLTGGTLNLQPANASFGGVITTDTQSFAGAKTFTSLILSKSGTAAGIAIDPNAATGDFTLSLSPANITAARRWSFPDRSDTVAGLGAQTFTGTQTFTPLALFSAGISITGGGIAVGTITRDATFGTTIWPNTGSTNDFSLFTAGGSYIARVPTGTGQILVETTTDATSTTAAALVVTGGIAWGAGKSAYGGSLVLGTDPSGSELLRVGGNGFFNGDVRAGAGSYFYNTSGILNVRAGGELRLGSNSVDNRARLTTSGEFVLGADPGGTDAVRIGGALTVNSAVMIQTKTAFTNGAAAAAGTLLNAPAAGNPTKWIPVNDNGTTRYLPAW